MGEVEGGDVVGFVAWNRGSAVVRVVGVGDCTKDDAVVPEDESAECGEEG